MSSTTITTKEAGSSSKRPQLRIGSAGALPNPLGSHPATPKFVKHMTIPIVKTTPPTPAEIRSCKTEIDQYLRDIKINGYVPAKIEPSASKEYYESDMMAMNLRMIHMKGEAPEVNYATKPMEKERKVTRSLTLPSRREVREKNGFSQEWKRMGSVYRFV